MSRRAWTAGTLLAATTIALVAPDAQATEPAYPEQKLVGSDATADAQFGHRIAIDGDYLITGAVTDSNFGQYSGAAYVFRRNGSEWVEDAVLRTPSPTGGERLGHAIDISGETAVVSTLDDSQGDGAVYVFERGADAWELATTLRAAVPTPDRHFGASVALDENTLAVSEQYAGIGGVVHLYDRLPSGWTHTQTVSGVAVSADDFFGRELALEGDTLVVGALGDDTSRQNSGAVYEFRRVGGVWTEADRLLAAEFGVDSTFGATVALSGSTLAVSGRVVQPGDTRATALIVLERDVTGWVHSATMLPMGIDEGQTFWGTIALDGDVLLAGTYTPDQLGAATVIERAAEGWAASELLRASDGQAVSLYGRFVALDGRTAVVSALRNLSDVVDTGAVYVYEGVGPEPIADGFLLPHSVRLRHPTAKRKRGAPDLKSKGTLDFGAEAVDLTAPLVVQVGSASFALPGLVTDRRGNVYSYDDGTVALSIRASKAGGSRASYALTIRDDLSTATSLDGLLRLGLRIGDATLEAEVALSSGKHSSRSRNARWREPELALTALKAKLSAVGPDRVSVDLCRPPASFAPPITEPVVIRVGAECEIEIPASAFKRRGSKDLFKGNIRGVRRVQIDQLRGRIQIVARGVELGDGFRAGAPQEIAVSIHGELQGSIVRLEPAGRKLRY